MDREAHDLMLKDQILEAYGARGYKKGSRRIKMFLERDYGICYNRKCIQRIMRKYNIQCPVRKRRPYSRKKTLEHTVAQNNLQRQFRQGVAGKVLLTDISYLTYGFGARAYLSTILDGETNEVLAYNVQKSMTMDLVLDTLKGMGQHDFIRNDAVIHSDQGWHYTNPVFHIRVRRMGLQQSMSRKGNCWDNAPQESFYGHMKSEAELGHCATFEELCAKISDYMDYYNHHRYQERLLKKNPC